jgi:ABC-type transport system substrate-binding protein
VRKILGVIFVLILIFYLGDLVADAFVPSRESIFNNFMDAVNREDSPLQSQRVEMALRYLIVDQNPEKAKQLLAEAGWFGGFSLNLSRERYAGNRLEIEWLITELEKINVYLKVTDY